MKKCLALFVLLCCCNLIMQAQSKTILGRVYNDSTGEPLAGATVKIRNSNVVTQTDASGNFQLKVNDTRAQDLVVSFTGFDEIVVKSSDNMSVAMRPNNRRMDEVVVIGYGSVRKKDLTGAVSSVKGEEIRKVAAGNVMEGIQGKVAGVDIVRTSGSAGATPNVTIRGNRSIIAGNGPLYLVDGIQYNNFQDINSQDIVSMEVLKDAASTAIYGSRGANGVILITTKKGSSGKPKVTANAYYGISEAVGYPVPMTGPEYADLKRQAFRTTGVWNSTADDARIFPNAADLKAVQDGVSTYWPSFNLTKGSQQEYGLGVSGGSDRTKVYFSFNYLKEEGLLQNDFSKRYTVRLNIEQSLSKSFKVGLESQLAYFDQNIRADNILTVANKVLPFYTPFNADGTVARFPGNGNQFNPLLQESEGAYVNQFNTTRILTTAFAEWRPFTGFSLRSNLGVVNGSTRGQFFMDANTIDRALSSGSLSRVTNNFQTDLTWENIANWSKDFAKHTVAVTAITSYLSFRTDESSAQGTGQLLASQGANALQNNPLNLAISSNYVGSNLISGAFRVNYDYDDRFLLTLTGRSDGSSVLAAQNRWAFFPSVAAAWRIAGESFMAQQHTITDLKLRASYGRAGNSAVRPYQTQTGAILIPYSWNDQTALAYGLNPQISNPDLGWEYTTTANIGLDFALWKNRVVGSVDVYESNTEDLLLLRQLPASTGGRTILQNIGKTNNKGIEVTLQTVNIQSASFRWASTITYTRNKEAIVELPNGQNDIANRWFIGHPVRSFYDFQKEGIWQIPDSAVARSYGYRPGDIRVADLDNSKTITALGDRMVLGSEVPDYSIGFNNDFSFKGFDLNFYIFARQGQMFVSDYANKFEPNAIENSAKVDYWTPENPTNSYPRPNANISRAALPFATTLGYQDGSFVKIRNITLGYTLPSKLTQKWKIQHLRWYVSARNYFVFSKIKDYDPEGGGSFERPLNKLLTTGLNVEF
jgi:TonB-dependent starch-binding outer membrane protein SusC